MSGWIALHRDMLRHWIFRDPVKLQAWIYFLMQAAWKDRKLPDGKYEGISEVKRGQLLGSESRWSRELNMHRSTFRRFLKELELDSMVNRHATKSWCLLTICNYEEYQKVLDQREINLNMDVNTHVVTSEQYNNTTIEINTKATKAKKCPSFPPALDVEEARAAWQRWCEYKREIKKPYKSIKSEEAMLARYASMTPAQFAADIEHSISQGYQGIYPAPSSVARKTSRPLTPFERAMEVNRTINLFTTEEA